MNNPKVWKPLLDFLAEDDSGQQQRSEWRDWQIDPVSGGHNNRLLRASHAELGTFAIKITLRDERNRARREFQTLELLQNAGVNIAPKPLFLDEESYPLPVVVQSWIDGAVCTAPPTADAEWMSLLAHYQTIHEIKPAPSTRHLPNAVLTAYTLAQARALIHRELALIPESAHPQLMDKLWNSVMEYAALDWDDSTISLCRGDANIRNFIEQPEVWFSVDWEYSGWGDPAFEIAELLAHPAYMGLPNARHRWLIDQYCSPAKDDNIQQRIQLYYQHMVVWWCARFARYRYEQPRGLDKRLATQKIGSLDGPESKYQHYLDLAENMEILQI